MRTPLKYLLLLGMVVAGFMACKRDSFTTNPQHRLNINADTLWFDTVFTHQSQGIPQSVNKQIVVRNPHDEFIRTSIVLAGGATSHFRLNVDGEPGYAFNDVEIFPNDSIFLFVEVHPDPNNNNPDFNPLIIRDSILFQTNGNEQKVNLIGWGQDAHYIFRDSIESDTTWADANLPIVVYGYCYVKPNVTLTIEEGMRVHFAPRSWLFVEGQVDIKGTKEDPVVMQGDRLQPTWEEEPGQWGGIWLNYPTHENTIEHAIIKNATVGVYCDTASGIIGTPNVTIRKSFIRNMTFDGVAGRYATVHMENSLVTNCGRYTFLASFGGDYTVLNNTFYMDTRQFSRNGPTFAYSNIHRNEFGSIISTHPIQFNFQNNIITGTYSEGEIGYDIDFNQTSGSTIVDYNLLQTQDASFSGGGSSNIVNRAVRFTDSNLLFKLDTLSPCKDAGNVLSPPITDDFDDKVRDGSPDIGALESLY